MGWTFDEFDRTDASDLLRTMVFVNLRDEMKQNSRPPQSPEYPNA